MSFLKALSLTILCTGLSACCDKGALPKNIQNLYSSSAHDRNEAALALAQCGSNAERAVPRLIQMLYDENVGVQSSSAYALRQIDTPAARSALDRASKK